MRASFRMVESFGTKGRWCRVPSARSPPTPRTWLLVPKNEVILYKKFDDRQTQ